MTAVLAGDSLHALAFELLADPATHEDPFARAELVVELAQASGPSGMAGGQMMDLVAEHEIYDLAGVTRLQALKTGALIGFCLEAGAIMGRVPESQRTPLRGYARDLGLAFQIADDLLDVEGTEDAAGKAVGKDAAAGKATFVSLLGVERARTIWTASVGAPGWSTGWAPALPQPRRNRGGSRSPSDRRRCDAKSKASLVSKSSNSMNC